MRKQKLYFLVLLLPLLSLLVLAIGRSQANSVKVEAIPNILLINYSTYEDLPAQVIQYDNSRQRLVVGAELHRGDHLAAAVDPVNNLLFLAGYDPELSSEKGSLTGFLAVLDATTKQVLHEESVPALFRSNFYIGGVSPLTSSPEEQRVYVQTWQETAPNLAKHAVLIFDTAKMEFLPLEIVLSSGHSLEEQCNSALLFPDAAHSILSVLCYRQDSVRFIDATTGKTVNEVFMPGVADAVNRSYGNSHVSGAVVAASSGLMYVVTSDARIIEVDLDNQRISQEIILTTSPDILTGSHNKIALSQDERFLYIAAAKDRQEGGGQPMEEIWIVDRDSWKTVSIITPDKPFTSMTYDESRDLLLLLNLYDSRLQIVDVQTESTLLNLEDVGFNAAEVLVLPSQNP